MKTWFEPLGARDAWFLYAERPDTPLDLATVYVFEGASQVPGGRGAQGIEETIAERLHLVPRYRQRVKRVPFHLEHPVWVDDASFDLGSHVRREVLPPPGTGAQFRAVAMRIMARPLDKRRPLWEITIVSGLQDGRVGIVNRAHHAMIDGASSLDIATLLLDASPEPYTPPPPAEPWQPRPAPSGWDLARRFFWDPLSKTGGGVACAGSRQPGGSPGEAGTAWDVRWSLRTASSSGTGRSDPSAQDAG